MQGESFLLTIAQVGLALGGFSGVIAVFRHDEQEWQPQEIAGLRLILEHAFAGVLFAFLPFPLSFMLSLQATVLSTTSFLLAVFLGFELYVQLRRAKAMTVSGYPPRRGKALQYFFFVTSVLALVQMLNVVWWQSLAVYSWGLIWLLVAPSIQFFHFVSEVSPPRN